MMQGALRSRGPACRPHQNCFVKRQLAIVNSHAPGKVQPSLDQQPARQLSHGRIEVILGPMFAGKSTELLSRVRAEREAGRNVALIKSAIDTRYSSQPLVMTHTGDRLPCFAIPTLMQFKSEHAAEYTSSQVIAVDEAQFFPDLLEFVRDAADLDNKTVLVAGLDGDFRRQRFGQLLDLIPLADAVVKLSSTCNFCSKGSLFSLRVVADERQELIGGKDKYLPVCREHYLEMSRVRSSIE